MTRVINERKLRSTDMMIPKTDFRHLLALLAALFLGAAVAQEVPSQEDAGESAQTPPSNEEPTESDAVEEEAADEEEVIDEEGLDDQGFEDEDSDDFVPTEEIPADQSIPFPTDI